MAASTMFKQLRRVTKCILDTSKVSKRRCLIHTTAAASAEAETDPTRAQFQVAGIGAEKPHHPASPRIPVACPEDDINQTLRDATVSFSTVKGASIYYQMVGHGNHTVLLLPGALGCAHTDFSVQLNTMNRDLFTLLAWDPRGYGKSAVEERDWPDHFLERDAHDAAGLMKNLDYKKYSLVGWRDGGITAMILAARYPNSVRRLVVWGSNAFVTPDDVKNYEAIRDVDKWSEEMKKSCCGCAGDKYFRKHWSLWMNAYEKYLTDRGGDICKEDLKKIKCPTLIIHGQKDPMVGQKHADYLRDNIEDARLVNLPDAKHDLHVKYFRKFNSLVESFLISQP